MTAQKQATLSYTNVVSRWLCRRELRRLDDIGEGAQLKGRPHLINRGRLTVGAGFILSSKPVQSHIVAMPGASIDIQDRVLISHGAAITAKRAIHIGSGTSIGPFVVIMDSDFHRPGNRHEAGDVSPIRIGDGVVIGARVTILRSSDIGDGARIMSGSMVSGVVPRGATYGGVPARLLNEGSAAGSMDIQELIKNVLGLAERPELEDGPSNIPEWDSLGTLRLLLAIEETFGISVREEEIHSARTVAALSEVAGRATERARLSL